MTRAERNCGTKRKKNSRTYCSLDQLGSVSSPDVTSSASVLLKAMKGQGARGKERETRGGDVAQRSRSTGREPKAKDQSRQATQGPERRIELARQVEQG